MIRKAIVAAFGILLAVAAPVIAEEAGSGRIGLGASSLGATGEVAYRFHSNFSVRGVAAGALSINETFSFDDQDYSVAYEPGGLGLLIDWHTGLGGLRFSGGAFYSDPSLTGSTSGAASVVINGITYTGTDNVNFGVSVANELAPAVTVGYDQTLGGNWILSAEAGGIFNGGYTVSATSENGVIPQADIDAEAQSIEDDLNSFGFYPYISIMVGMRF